MISVNNYPILLLDFDINKTLVLEESSNGADCEQMLMSILAENTFYDWEGKGIMSFKDYVYNLLPGEKSDRAIKTKRMEKIANFLKWLTEQDHPVKDQVYSDYKEIKDKSTQQDTHEIKTTVFNSFFVLLDKLRSLKIPFVIKLRTFGKHLDSVTKQIEAHPSGIQFSHVGTFSGQILTINGEESIDKIDQIFHKFLTAQGHFALKDDWKKWNADKERRASGKSFVYDSFGNQHQIRNLSLFFDDNITGEEEFGIVNSIDISNKQVASKELLDRILFKVNTVEAIKNDYYFFNLVQKALAENGYPVK